jgi:hypothetical protein
VQRQNTEQEGSWDKGLPQTAKMFLCTPMIMLRVMVSTMIRVVKECMIRKKRKKHGDALI